MTNDCHLGFLQFHCSHERVEELGVVELSVVEPLRFVSFSSQLEEEEEEEEEEVKNHTNLNTLLVRPYPARSKRTILFRNACQRS